MAARRWIGLTWPTEHGGAGRPGIDRMIVADELISAGAPVGAYHEVRVADFVGRIFAADTLLAGDAARAVCYAPAYTIMGGTANVMRNIVAERLLGLPR